MKRTISIILSLGCLLLVALILFSRSQPSKKQNSNAAPGEPATSVSFAATQGSNKGDQKTPLPPEQQVAADLPPALAIAALERIYATPIAFYGKVVDETGTPIARARVKLVVHDQPNENGSEYQQQTDDSGLFALQTKGAALSVFVSKIGYYSNGESQARFVYGLPGSSGDSQRPTVNAPAVFVLRKMGSAARLIVVERNIRIPKDGRPVDISVRTGRAVVDGAGDITVQCWTNSDEVPRFSNSGYDWRMKLTVPGGGLVERTGEYSFEAPEAGYRESDEVNMSKDAKGWRRTFEGDYFLKLRDGTFARVNLNMVAHGEHFVALKAFVSPVPGKRNLEFDAANAIRSQ